MCLPILRDSYVFEGQNIPQQKLLKTKGKVVNPVCHIRK